MCTSLWMCIMNVWMDIGSFNFTLAYAAGFFLLWGVLISVILMRYASYILGWTCSRPNLFYHGNYISVLSVVAKQAIVLFLQCVSFIVRIVLFLGLFLRSYLLLQFWGINTEIIPINTGHISVQCASIF